MNMIDPIERLIASFKTLPGVGQKTAERYAYSIINKDIERAEEFSKAITEAKLKIKYCKECGNYTDSDICHICKSRPADIICVVKEPKDVSTMERVKNFECVYHVLHGCISPLNNKGPDDIRIKELLERVNSEDVHEVIVATNPDVEGEATAMYISRLLKPLGIKVTRLAQGIAMGSDLEFADEITLSRAIEARREI